MYSVLVPSFRQPHDVISETDVSNHIILVSLSIFKRYFRYQYVASRKLILLHVVGPIVLDPEIDGVGQ
jgi:hypothetical protein